jgi:protein-tyrosine phosphatase
MKSVLIVCLGNICRSPAGEEIFRRICAKHHKEYYVESCGMGDWYVGHPSDARMKQAAQSRGYHLTKISQQFNEGFFEGFDYIIAVDRDVLHDLYLKALTPEHKAKIHLLTDYSVSYKGEDIPDPFYKGEEGFELVLDMLEESCQGLFDHLENQDKRQNDPNDQKDIND